MESNFVLQKEKRMDYQDLGRRVRMQRLQLDWTQEQLAKAIGVSTSFVGHIERGTRKASIDTLVEIANAMNISVETLLYASLKHHYSIRQNAMRELLSELQQRLVEWETPAEEQPEEGQDQPSI